MPLWGETEAGMRPESPVKAAQQHYDIPYQMTFTAKR